MKMSCAASQVLVLAAPQPSMHESKAPNLVQFLLALLWLTTQDCDKLQIQVSACSVSTSQTHTVQLCIRTAA